MQLSPFHATPTFKALPQLSLVPAALGTGAEPPQMLPAAVPLQQPRGRTRRWVQGYFQGSPAGSTFLPQAKRFWESTGGYFFFFQEGPDTSRNDAEQVDFVHTTGVSAACPLAPSLHGEDTLLAFSGSLSVLLPKLQLSRADTTAQQEHAPCLLHRGKGCSSLTTCHGIRRGTGTCLSRSGTRR